jgi:hypothetical protein
MSVCEKWTRSQTGAFCLALRCVEKAVSTADTAFSPRLDPVKNRSFCASRHFSHTLYDTRLKFLVNGQNGGKGAPMSCAMIYWGKNFERFNASFKKFGAVIDLRPLKGKQFGVCSENGQMDLIAEEHFP